MFIFTQKRKAVSDNEFKRSGTKHGKMNFCISEDAKLCIKDVKF